MLKFFRNLHWIVMSTFCVVFTPSALIAADQFYADDAQGIIEKLQEDTKQVQSNGNGTSSMAGKVRLRSFPGSTPLPAQQAVIKTRTIKRLQENQQGAPIPEVVSVPEETQQPHVNLKIEFDVNSYAIRSASFSLLAELGKALSSSELQNKNFMINGHTDADGSDEHNLQLSFNRARSVKQFLQVNYSVSADRLTVIGYGESMPMIENNNYAGKQMNRRVEVVVK